MADSPTIVVARLDDKELQESIKSMVTSFNKGLDDMKTHADSVVEAINASLKGIKGGSVSSGGTADGGFTKRVKAQETEAKAVANTAMTYDNLQSTISKVTQSSEKYTDEIRKQAQAIRESQEWKEKGRYTFADGTTIYNLENEKKNRVALEQQILDYQHKQAQAALISAASEEKVEQAALRAAMAMHNVNAEAAESNRILRGKGGANESLFQRYGDLRSSVAAVLNVEQSRVNIADIETASTKKLSASLRQLQEAYDKLSAADRNSHQGKELVFNIQQIQREIQKIKAQASRPISLDDVLNLPTNTLDEITYKMRQLQAYKGGLNLETQKNEMRDVNKAYDSLRRAQLKYMSDSQKLSGINEALGRSWNYMKNRLAFYFTVGASTQLVKELIKVRSEYEMNERALGILVDSAERGTQIFRELSQMSLVSPYTLIELSSAAKQLTAYDVAAKDVVDTTRRLADMASAVGVPIERLTYALGQIKAYGYLNSRDNRMFLNAGIPLVRQLADYYSDLEGKMVSTADVYDRIKQKAVDYNDVMQVLNRMTDEGGRFFDFQGKMAETLKVQLANLTLAWNNMLNDIGQQTQGFAVNVFKVLRQLFVHWKDIDAAIWAFFHTLVVGAAGGAVYKFLDFLRQLKTGAVTAQSAIGGLQTSLIRFSKSAAWANIKGGGWFLLLSALSNAVWEVAFNFDSATEEMSKAVRESAENTYKDISEFLDGKELRRIIKSLREGTAEGQNEDNLSKAWEKVREEILLVSMAGEGYVQTLQEIEDVGERLQKGFGILEDVQTVAAVLKDMGDYGIAVQKDWSQFWNLWMLPDGLFENLRDYGKELDDVIEKYGSLEALRSQVYGQNGQRLYGTDAAKDYDNLATAQQRFNENLQTTITSIHKIISLNEGWSSDVGKINELYAQVAHNLALQGSLSPEETFNLQLAMEKERAKDAKEAIQVRLADETAALNRALDEQSKMRIRSNIETLMAELQDFDKYNGESKVYWNDFTKYIKERRISEAREMFKGLSAEEIQSLDFSKGKYKEWVDDMVSGYAKSHKMSYDEAFRYLHNWVRSANKWSIFIPLTISTEDSKTEMQILEEADAAYQQAEKEIERLTTRKKELEALGASSVGTSKKDKEYAKTLKEITQAEKDLEDARAKGGNGKEKKSGSGGSKKDPVLDALKTEIKLVEQLQGEYDKLTKSGASSDDALATIRGAFGNTIKQLNSQLRGYGLPELTTQLITGKDPNKALAHFKQTLQSLVDKGMMSLERSKEVEAIIEKLTISAKTYNLDKITKGLNSELDKLKEEYELAVALDTDPELGNVFASYFGIDTEKLPHDFEQVAKLAQERIGKVLQENHYEGTVIDVESLLDKKKFDQWVKDSGQEMGSNLVKELEAIRAFLHKTQVDEIKSQEEAWKKLTEKYTAYQYKITRIERDADAERQALINKTGNAKQKEIAQKLIEDIKVAPTPDAKDSLRSDLKALALEVSENNPATIMLNVAIDNEEMEKKAHEAFEEFQKSPTWITATGELGTLSRNALGLLIDRIEEYKKKAKGLNGKEIKRINQALRTLRKEMHKDNPFYELVDAIRQAKTTQSDYTREIVAQERELANLQYRQKAGVKLTADEQKRMDELVESIQKLKEEKKATGKVSFETIFKAAQSIQAVFQTVTSSVSEMLDALGGTKSSQTLKDINTVLDKMGSFAAMGKAFGGGWGALAGAIVGAGLGIVQVLGEVLTGNSEITESVEESETELSRLEMRYKELEHTIEKSYGAARVGALRAAQASKKAQLEEVERQLRLEQNRNQKYKDEDKIVELQGKANDLRNEINDMVDDFVNDLMGISSVGDAMENVVSSMIDAFKKGEDYMKEYDDSFAEMIDNMIAKSIASQLIGDTIEEIAKKIKDAAWERQDINAKQKEYEQLVGTGEGSIQWTREQIEKWIRAKTIHSSIEDIEALMEKYPEMANSVVGQWIQQFRDMERRAEALRQEINRGVVVTPEDVEAVREDAQAARERVKENFEALMEAYGITFGQDAEGAKLSALQAGIQGVSEETASALESYMNGVSQQVYLHSTLLTQIRDVMVQFDPEVSMGIQSQMLLQLQQSYQVQMSIESILQGVLNPSGRAFAVEIIS